MDKKFGIIYFASNKINNKVYIGQTVLKLNKRIKQHLTMNKNNPFGNSLSKYGEKNFNFGTIEYPIEKLNEMEIYWIRKLDTKIPNGYGYNCGDGGEGNRGYKFTKEQSKNLKIIQKILHNRPEVRKRHSDSAKISSNRPEVIKRNSEAQKIAQNRPEVRKRNSEAQKIAQNRPEVRKRKSDILKKFWKNPKHKERQSKIVKKRFENIEEREKLSKAIIKSNKENPQNNINNSKAQIKSYNENKNRRINQSKKMKKVWKDLKHKIKCCKQYNFKAPDNREYKVTDGFNNFCIEHNLIKRNMVDVLAGRQRNHKGWTVKYAEI